MHPQTARLAARIAHIREMFERREAPSQLLEFIGTVFIPATHQPLVAQEKFAGGTTGGNIFRLGRNFKKWFLGKREAPIPETTLRYAKLVKSSLEGPILAQLVNKVETKLAPIFFLMEYQKNGEAGVLLNNGLANVFYVGDVNGKLRAVCVRWDGNEWCVSTHSVTNQRTWIDGGSRVFSRSPRFAGEAGNS